MSLVGLILGRIKIGLRDKDISPGYNVSIASTAYSTVLKARVETRRLLAYPRTVRQLYDMDKHTTDHITILKYDCETLLLDEISLLIRDGDT